MNELPNESNAEYILPALTAGITNQGLNNYVKPESATILKDVISISANGANTGATFYQSKEFTILQDAYAIDLIDRDEDCITNSVWLYLTTAIRKAIYGIYEWTNKAGWERIKYNKIFLPQKGGRLDFAYMDSFVSELKAQHVAELKAQHAAELKAYFSITGLDNYELTLPEQNVLDILANSKMEFTDISFGQIFDCIKQGRRLKKDEQKKGMIPFIMSGITNTGVVNYISNPVVMFPKNSITLDIFGNVFYRNFEFGAGDDTGVYWSKSKQYSSKNMLFFATAMSVAVAGQYSYGHKLRSSQSIDLIMKLPVSNGEIDIKTMELLISAVQKLVIKDVVLYARRKVNLTESVIEKL